MSVTSMFDNLRANCEKCFGLCCVALFFSASDGFPTNKEAGKSCIHLESNFRCKVHKSLSQRGLKGCVAYECFGAGQKVCQKTFAQEDWLINPHIKQKMFDVFMIMKELHEMIWYLVEALTRKETSPFQGEIRTLLNNTEHLTNLTPDELSNINVERVRESINELLIKTSQAVRLKYYPEEGEPTSAKKQLGGRIDYIGANLKGLHLRGENLRGAYLIAADLRGADLSGTDFIGADFRDASIKGADFSKSLFLTQHQINSCNGNQYTKLPKSLIRPAHW